MLSENHLRTKAPALHESRLKGCGKGFRSERVALIPGTNKYNAEASSREKNLFEVSPGVHRRGCSSCRYCNTNLYFLCISAQAERVLYIIRYVQSVRRLFYST